MRYLPLIKNFQKGKLIISKIEINLYLTIKLILVKTNQQLILNLIKQILSQSTKKLLAK